MNKTKKNIKSSKTQETFLSKFNLEEFLPQKYHILAVILVIIILFLIFLNPLYFGNKTFQSSDILASLASQQYVLHHGDGFTLWNPYLFCGMPAYAIGTAPSWFNLIYAGITEMRSIFTSFFSIEYTQWTFYLIILGITSFFLMRHLTRNTLVSLFTAIATSFSTGLIVFLFIGHVTKLTALSMYPLVFLLLLRLKERLRLIDILLLIITLQLLIQSFHVQIIFYTLFSAAIYFIYYFLRSLATRDTGLRKNILKSAGVFVAVSIIAFLIQTDNLTQIYEYMPFSTRGSIGILEKTSNETTKSTSEYYKYHTDWSFSPEEVATFIIPSYYGFGNVTYQGPLTRGQEVQTNTYFGQMPFVDVAVGYMGIIVFMLALFGIFTRWKEPFVRFLTILTGVALLISFGRNFPILFDLLFYNLPYFDKFRVPSMILVLVQLSIPVLAGLGLMKIINLHNERDEKLIKLIKNIAIVFSVIFILSILFSSGVSGWMADRVNAYADTIAASRSQNAQQFRALADFIGDMFRTDFFIAFGFLSAAFWGSYLYIKGRLSKDVLVLGIIILTIIDLWRIDARGERYQNNPDMKKEFNTPDYITAIKNQKDKNPFRIINLKQDNSLGSIANNENFNMYFLVEDFYGYSAIKPRSFQDYMDVVGPVNTTIWRMLNVKYLVADRPVPFEGFKEIMNNSKTYVYLNTNALPRLYFVNQVEQKPDIDVLMSVKDNGFDPKQVAYVNNLKTKIDVPDSTASVTITAYKDELVSADVNSSGNNFLFFGDTYIAGKADYKLFKLSTGWSAYIDGNKTEIYRVNHGFMGIVVPKGKHSVEFKYAPESFYISKYLSLILSSLTVGSLLLILLLNRKKKEKAAA
jgi:hypothetical protein